MQKITNTEKVEVINKIFGLRSIFESRGNGLIFSEFNLTTSLYEPLKMLECGMDSILEMRKWVRESPASLTQKISKLEKLELITRKICIEDKRKWKLSFTKKGKDTMKKIQKKLEKESQGVFENFSDNEIKSLLKSLGKLEMTLLEKLKEKHIS